MGIQPLIFCAYDYCCQFEPGSHNARYCMLHNCKRKQENALKRVVTEHPHDPTDLWQLQEDRKKGNMKLAQAKNDWLLGKSSFAFFDLETFDLSAEFGLVLVSCIKWRGGPTQTFVAHGDKDERECLLATRDTLEQADFVVTYYGTGFDIPYLNTRLLINKERPIGEFRHIDAYYTAKHKLRLQRNRMANVELALLESVQKTAIKPGIWRKALQGNKEALDYIVDHCQRDVAILGDIFEQLKGFINLSAVRWRRYGGSY